MKFIKVLPIILIISYVLLTFKVQAQSNYTFQYYNNEYSELVDDEIIFDVVNYNLWASDEWSLPLDFTFNFMGKDYENILISNGKMRFDVNNDEVYIFPYFTELIDRNYWNNPITEIISPVSYKYENVNGQQILKIQHKNVGFFDGEPGDFANFQTWLYEGSNMIEFHYGESEIISTTAFSSQDDAIYGPLVGIIDGDAENPYYLVYENSDAPSILTDPENFGEGLIGSPPNNIVYQFSPNTVNTNELENLSDQIGISPNPTSGTFNIAIQHPNQIAHVVIYNSSGKILQTIAHLSAITNIDLNLDAGIYFVEVMNHIGVSSLEKVVILK